MFYLQTTSRCALAAGKLLGDALAHKIPLNPQWVPRCATNAPKLTKAHQKAGKVTPNVPKMLPKGDLGTALGQTLVQIYRKGDML